MLKKLISAVLIIMFLFAFTSCDKVSNNNATIQVWTYDFINASAYSEALASVLSNIRFFCDSNGIPVEIVTYNEKTISYDDYVLKRNTAAASGNMIIIEDAKYISDLSKQHADYAKLDNYNNLLDAYKNKFCIPLGVGHTVTYKYNDAINYYNISTDNPLITYDEYLEIKQQMKEKGAKFKLSYWEFKQLVDYFLIKNNINYINQESEILRDSNKFKESLKNTLIQLCDDFRLYNNSTLNPDIRYTDSDNSTFNKKDYTIYDENSELVLCDFPGVYLITYYGSYAYGSISDKTFVIDPNVFESPSFFMHKKITNDKIYDLANHIVSENSYLSLAGSRMAYYYSPVFNGEKTKKMFDLNEDWQYEGEYKARAEKGNDTDKRAYALFNEIYNVIAKDEEKSNLLAKYYYANEEYSEKIHDFISDVIIELSKESYNYKNEEINNMIDKKIDEFITNFIIHYK